MRPLYFSREQLTADDVSARPLGASVAPLALGYVDRSTHIIHVENPRRSRSSPVPGVASTFFKTILQVTGCDYYAHTGQTYT